VADQLHERRQKHYPSLVFYGDDGRRGLDSSSLLPLLTRRTLPRKQNPRAALNAIRAVGEQIVDAIAASPTARGAVRCGEGLPRPQLATGTPPLLEVQKLAKRFDQGAPAARRPVSASPAPSHAGGGCWCWTSRRRSTFPCRRSCCNCSIACGARMNSLSCHDLNVVRMMRDRSIVLRNGRIVLRGESRALFDDPQEAYNRELVDAVPHVDAGLTAPATSLAATSGG
jgi:hypothetical protein